MFFILFSFDDMIIYYFINFRHQKRVSSPKKGVTIFTWSKRAKNLSKRHNTGKNPTKKIQWSSYPDISFLHYYNILRENNTEREKEVFLYTPQAYNKK